MTYFVRIVFLISLAVTISCSAQLNWAKDTAIANIRNNLPKGWVIGIKDSCIIIIRIKPVYKTLTNDTNEQVSREEKRITTDTDIPPDNSVKDTMEIVLKMTPRWSEKKYKEIKQNNDHYRIESDRIHFKRKEDGSDYIVSKGGTVGTFIGDSIIDKYNDSIDYEVSLLDRNIVSIPEICTQFYFLDYAYSEKDNAEYPMSYDVFPEQANLEQKEIREYISNACDCARQYENHK
jgi:hypothetical protein